MDPLSVTASAIALGSLVRSTLISLNNIARDYKTFSQELETLGAELQSLSLVVSAIEKSIEGNSILQAPLDNKYLINALEACRPTLKAIKTKCKEIRRAASQGSLNKLMVGLFWSSTRKEFQEMRSSLESHKTTLLLSLQLKSMELHLSSIGQKSKEDKSGTLGDSRPDNLVEGANQKERKSTNSNRSTESEFLLENQSQGEEYNSKWWEKKGGRKDEWWKDEELKKTKWGNDDTWNKDETWDEDERWKEYSSWMIGNWEENKKWKEDDISRERSNWKEGGDWGIDNDWYKNKTKEWERTESWGNKE